MKKIIKRIIGGGKMVGNPFVGKRGDCHEHDSILLPHIAANEVCHSCNSKHCYICSTRHMEQKCDVVWMKQFESLPGYATISPKNQHLNAGYLAVLNLKDLTCECGKPVEKGENPGICAACASATCSKHCHDVHMRDTNQCFFHHNFTRELSANQSMRSLLLGNVRYLQKQGMAVGTPVSKNTANFLRGFLGPNNDQIYLQRGYRQYGQPNQRTLDNIEVITEKNLDYVMLREKACTCKCSTCKHKDLHPVFNCEIDCRSGEGLIYAGLADDERMQDNCTCQCSFCTSGRTIFAHRKLDCVYNCKRSNF